MCKKLRESGGMKGSDMDTESPSKKALEVIESWQKQLIDFTRRNHQLYFQLEPARCRIATIKIKDHIPDSVIEACSEKKEGQGLLFDNVEPRRAIMWEGSTGLGIPRGIRYSCGVLR
jgi:hypothetical protein